MHFLFQMELNEWLEKSPSKPFDKHPSTAQGDDDLDELSGFRCREISMDSSMPPSLACELCCRLLFELGKKHGPGEFSTEASDDSGSSILRTSVSLRFKPGNLFNPGDNHNDTKDIMKQC